jgi:serine/threonine protein kinase
VELNTKKNKRWVRGDLIQVTPSWSAYNGLDTETGEFIIVKEIAIASDTTNQEKARYHELTEQLSVLERKNLNHPNLLTILGYEVKEDLTRIVSIAWIHGTIKTVLEKQGSLEEATARFFTRQILNGLVDLYANEELHGNLSTDNTFLEVGGIVKVSDFGLPESTIAYSNFVSAQAPETANQTNQSKPLSQRTLKMMMNTKRSLEE